ncbi:MAG: UDP-N-acetylmuramoyl-tripeptide--D-alanyl-D-alanine ligase [Rickettsiales bacterium]|nr:UDP-N-acetylmuramoyl-tripeptide--D-alanyl-D-alanine ligase [Rickettsiales bacterium]
MTILWDAQDVAAAIGATERSGWKAQRVTSDSRKLQAGDLFIALKGEHFDGHDFVAEALRQGASAAIVSCEPKGCAGDVRLIRVADTLHALQQLGKAGRERSTAKVVGVTGSVGKTSCKEALALAFGAQARTYASQGNLNNHIGLPLMLANMPPLTEVAIIEMGMNHAGEIALLSSLAQPDVAIITAVEAVHIEFFDSVEAIADAKSEISVGLRSGGTLLLPSDNPHFARLTQSAKDYGVTNIRAFGAGEAALPRLLDYQVHAAGSRARILTSKGEIDLHMQAVGRHWAVMMSGVLAAVEALGYDVTLATKALAAFSEPSGRGRALKQLLKNGVEIMILDDSYNASPASMRAALARLDDIWRAQGSTGRKLAALGDMRELGDHAASMHRDLAPDLTRYGVNQLYACGSHMRGLYDAVPQAMQGHWATSVDELAQALLPVLKNGDILLVKGSRGSAMDKVVSAIATDNTQSDQRKTSHVV